MTYLPQALLALVTIVAAVFDYRQRRVPNWLTLSAVLIGIGLNSLLFQTAGLWLSMRGFALALLIYVPLYLLRAVGGGDVKLMAAVGAIAGPANWLGIMIITAIFGGIAAIVLVALQHRFRRTLENIWVILTSLAHGKTPFKHNTQLDVRNEQAVRLPHAVVIAFGTFAFLLLSRAQAGVSVISYLSTP